MVRQTNNCDPVHTGVYHNRIGWNTRRPTNSLVRLGEEACAPFTEGE